MSKGLAERNGMGAGGKTYQGEGGRKLLSVGGVLIRFCPAPFSFSPPPPVGLLWEFGYTLPT